MPSSKQLFLGATKTTIAQLLPHVSPADLPGSRTLAEAGLLPEQYPEVARILYDTLESSSIHLPPRDNFASILSLAPTRTIGAIARLARNSSQTCTCPQPATPGPSFSCSDWFDDCFLCRVSCAVQRWAAHVPEDGITGDTTLESVQLFSDQTCARLMELLEAQNPFTPFPVPFLPVCNSIAPKTTVRELAVILYNSRSTPCTAVFQP